MEIFDDTGSTSTSSFQQARDPAMKHYWNDSQEKSCSTAGPTMMSIDVFRIRSAPLTCLSTLLSGFFMTTNLECNRMFFSRIRYCALRPQYGNAQDSWISQLRLNETSMQDIFMRCSSYVHIHTCMAEPQDFETVAGGATLVRYEYLCSLHSPLNQR